MSFQGYSKGAWLKGALKNADMMQQHGIPTSRNLVHQILEECMERPDLESSRQVQSLIVHSQVDSVAVFADHLIRLFASCGSLIESSQVFTKVIKPSEYTWSSIVAAHAKLRQGEIGIQLYESMILSGTTRNQFIYAAVLKACSATLALEHGRLIHDMIVYDGIRSDVLLGNMLISLYAKCGKLDEAHEVFNQLPQRDTITWNAMIAGYSENCKSHFALDCFDQMKHAGIEPDRLSFLSILKACANVSAIEKIQEIHRQIMRSKFQSEDTVANALLNAHAKCGNLEEACKVFDLLSNPNSVAWSAMIAGHVQHREDSLPLECFTKMQHQATNVDEFTFSSVLKGCASVGFIEHGRYIHGQIIEISVEVDNTLGNALVNMYAKCGNLEEAIKVFHRLQSRDVISWSTMIAGYAQCGDGALALEYFEKMQCAHIEPDKVTLASALKACSKIGVVDQGKRIHEKIIQMGLKHDIILENMLIDMYAKCGNLEEAQAIFDDLSNRNIGSWAALIAGYAYHNESGTALECFESMLHENIKPDKLTLLSILKANCGIAAIEQGRYVHEHAIESGLCSDVVVGNMLIDMYMKCGEIEEAHRVFHNLHSRDLVSWSIMIAGYSHRRRGLHALECYSNMLQEGIYPDKVMFLSILKACSSICDDQSGRSIHKQITLTGLHSDIVLGNTLVDMYAKCGRLEEANRVFNDLPNPNVVSWGAMIAGYAEQSRGLLALTCFDAMQYQGIEPDPVTISSILNACGSIGAIYDGRLIHGQIMNTGIQVDAVLGSSVVDMYAKCGNLAEARSIFQIFSHQNVVIWGAMIAGYAQHNQGASALDCFVSMQAKGLNADKVVFLSTLKACRNIGAIEQGRCIHGQIIETGLQLDDNLATMVIDMYASIKSLGEARGVFDRLKNKNAMLWGAMIAAYTHQGESILALGCFRSMQYEGIKPDQSIFLSILKACSNIGAFSQGRQAHEQIIENGLLIDLILCSTLVHMYANCGNLEEARKVFDKLSYQDATSWGAMISGYVQLGELCFAIQCFEDMQCCDIKPDDIAFTSILVACCRAGLIDEGLGYLRSMKECHGVIPDRVHYTCVVHLLGLRGYFGEAEHLLQASMQPNICGWMTLLNACKMHGNLMLAQRCFEQIASFDLHYAVNNCSIEEDLHKLGGPWMIRPQEILRY